MEPRKPENIGAFASTIMLALSDSGLGDRISIGGAFGLLHFLSHRETHDIDAWWESTTSGSDRERVLTLIEETLVRFGETRRRSWGDVVSIDLRQEGQTVFNFQIAERSARLEPPIRTSWVAVNLDSIIDLVASKMTALVERGAPRDFLDVRSVCGANLMTPVQCWEVWRRRQERAGSDADFSRARLALETHLQRIESQRPLSSIQQTDRRAEAAETRRWFREDFLDAIPD